MRKCIISTSEPLFRVGETVEIDGNTMQVTDVTSTTITIEKFSLVRRMLRFMYFKLLQVRDLFRRLFK